MVTAIPVVHKQLECALFYHMCDVVRSLFRDSLVTPVDLSF